MNAANVGPDKITVLRADEATILLRACITLSKEEHSLEKVYTWFWITQTNYTQWGLPSKRG